MFLFVLTENAYGDNGAVTGPLITTPAGGGHGFVSIDGRKTYFDLFPSATESLGPTQGQTVGTGVGIVIPEVDIVGEGGHGGFYEVKPLQEQPTASSPVRGGGYAPTQPPLPTPTQTSARPKPLVRKPTYNRKPIQPPIR
ncbi:hypothetical protein SK128_011480 [Halocaridina rubra]|uniref:Uncharacterized protein n=1 Tax=Halocaridina rubra TaxID=373956 RepID=A0AAN9ACJ9_HALRR